MTHFAERSIGLANLPVSLPLNVQLIDALCQLSCLLAQHASLLYRP